MNWNAQITSLTIRLYKDPDGFKKREPYIAVAQVELFSTGEAYIHAVLKKDGLNISVSQWAALCALLVDSFNVKTIKLERHNREVTFDAVKLAEKHYKSQQEK